MAFDKMRTKHLQQVRMLLGDAIIREADIDEDVKRATDLMILTAHDKRIACRIRTHEYYRRYREQFTIRSRATFGGKTEIDKILAGWGDYMFYGFEDHSGSNLCAAVILDLEIFRSSFYCGNCGIEMENRDGTAFLVFNIEDFPSRLVIASYPKMYWLTRQMMEWSGLFNKQPIIPVNTQEIDSHWYAMARNYGIDGDV